MTSSLVLRTPAKINPVLEVLGPRPDGYHELRLVFQAVALYDELVFEKAAEGVALEIPESPAPLAADDSNLVVKAARLFLREIGKGAGGVRIRLQKNIPLAAGLGGGSSDAAAALRGLDELFQTHAAPGTLLDLAARLGSDVPFFLYGGTGLGEGRGEKITPWEEGFEFHLVLVKPAAGLSTPAVYRSGKACYTRGDRAGDFRQVLRQKDIRRMAEHLFNGLEPAAQFLLPETAELKEGLLKAGALGALVSGSGPTVFGLAEDADQARRIADRLEGGGRTVVATKAVSSGIQIL